MTRGPVLQHLSQVEERLTEVEQAVVLLEELADAHVSGDVEHEVVELQEV
jgi:hypothetical protein